MNPIRIFGIILLVGGLIFLYFGLRATESVGESIKEGLTGTFTDATTWQIILGAIATVVGGWMTFAGSRSK